MLNKCLWDTGSENSESASRSEADTENVGFTQTHSLLAFAEVTWPRLLRPQLQASNREGERLDPRWSAGRRAQEAARSPGWGTHLMTARAAHPALPLTRRRAARALRGGRGGEGHPGARPAPDPALARPPPRPARTHAGKPRMRALGRGGRAALAPPPAAANPGARTAPLPASPRPGGPARGPADVSERSAVQGAQSRWRTRRATLSRSPARAVARALAGWLSLHFFPPSLPASLPLSPPTRAPGCSRLPRALPLSRRLHRAMRTLGASDTASR